MSTTTVQLRVAAPRLRMLGQVTVVAWMRARRGLARRPVLTGAGRWGLLPLSVYLFVVMFPAVFGGPMVVGQIAIGIWMMMFAWLGPSMTRNGPEVRP